MGSVNVYFTKEQLQDFIANHKKIGEGTEGICFKNGNEIYKVYKNTFEEPEVPKYVTPEYNSEGVRIYKKEDFRNVVNKKNPNKLIKYTSEDGTLLHTEQALEKVIDKGQRIVGTKIPQKIIYVNGVARGCVYPYHRFTSSIYKSFRRTFKTRLKICRLLLEKVQELIDNNIYPIDLCQKGPDSLFDKNYANVLLNIKNEPLIIDLDGKSALYTDVPNPSYEKMSCVTLSNLILEILTREDIQEDFNEEDFDGIYSYLSEAGLNDEMIHKFLDGSMTMKDIEESINLIEGKRK
jgi:hypothetical protein